MIPRGMVTGKLEWRLAGGCPQPARGVYLSRMVSPGARRNANCNLAPKILLSSELIDNEIDWLLQGLLEEQSAYLTAQS